MNDAEVLDAVESTFVIVFLMLSILSRFSLAFFNLMGAMVSNVLEKIVTMLLVICIYGYTEQLR